MKTIAACWFVGWVVYACSSIGHYSPAETFGTDLPIIIAIFVGASMSFGGLAAVEIMNESQQRKAK